MDLNNLNAKQLKKVILNASVALDRRKKVEKAIAEIQRVLKKYKLNKTELEITLSSLQSTKTAPSSSAKSVRAVVEPKYQSPNDSKTWTGRGRTPLWVIEICQSEGLTVEKFKSDERFLIGKSLPSSRSADRG